MVEDRRVLGTLAVFDELHQAALVAELLADAADLGGIEALQVDPIRLRLVAVARQDREHRGCQVLALRAVPGRILELRVDAGLPARALVAAWHELQLLLEGGDLE